MVLLDAPKPRQSSRISDLKDAGLLVLPLDVGGVSLTRVIEQLLQEVPEEAPVSGGRLPGLSLSRPGPVPGAA